MKETTAAYRYHKNGGFSRLTLVSVLFFSQMFLHGPVYGQSRRLKADEKIPEFSVKTVDGSVYEYKHENGKVLLACFLTEGQKRSEDAAGDIIRLTGKLKCDPEQIDVVVIVENSEAVGLFKESDTGRIKPKVILDKDYELWGAFGIIALPTIVIGDSGGKVAWVSAGYGYDFYGQLEARVNFSLGFRGRVDSEELEKVKTAKNDSLAGKAARNLHIAKTLKDKGKYEIALMLADKAAKIDPNSVEVKLFVGELYCLSGKSEQALEIAENLTAKANDRAIQSRISLIKGLAYRDLKKFEQSEKYLLNAVKVEPLSVRYYFELGNLYRQRKKYEKAAEAYHSALMLLEGKEF